MKLRNKKTGEIGLVHCDATMFSSKIGVFIDNNHIDLRNPYKIYTSLAELTEEWEDYEEQCWYINSTGEVREGILDADWRDEQRIGNYFETKEEAEKAVEKLKAWKRLKDARFEFGTIKYNLDEESSNTIAYDGIITIKGIAYEDFVDDLDLLFSQEDD